MMTVDGNLFIESFLFIVSLVVNLSLTVSGTPLFETDVCLFI